MTRSYYVGSAPQEWEARSACLGTDADFFPGPNDPKAEALALCKGCPVKRQCLADAVANPSVQGIRAGTTEKERRRLRRARRGA